MLAHLNVAREGFDRRMETRKGTAESPRGLCERSSSTRPVNEAKQGRMMRKGNKGKERRESRPKDSGSAVRLELVREREVISVMEVNSLGMVVAKTLQATRRAMARGDSMPHEKKGNEPLVNGKKGLMKDYLWW